MAVDPARFERPAATALALLFALLALYGCWSAPGLVERWGVSALGIALLALWGCAAGWAVGIAVRAPSRIGWGAFAAAAIVMRVAALGIAIGRVSPGDPQAYLALAGHLIAGDGLFLDDPAMATRAYAEFPPVYPLLLAGWGRWFGLAMPSVLLLSTLLDGGTAVLIARLGERLGEARAGLAAAALYLIWPSVVLNAPLAQKESLELLLVLALVHGWLGAGERPAWRSALAVGVPAALLALTQPGMAALAALIGVALLPGIALGRWSRAAGLGIVVTLAVMLPWWVRNWQVFHAFVPLTSVGGLSLWIGENPDATGNWMPYPTALAGLPELEIARRAGRMAIAWMTQNPEEVARLNAAKFLRAGGIGQFPLVRLDAMKPGLAPHAAAALLPISHGAHVLMLGAGAAALTVQRHWRLTALIAAVVVQMGAFGLWFEFGERHRELLTPFLLLAIAVGTAAIVRRRTVPADACAVRPAA